MSETGAYCLDREERAVQSAISLGAETSPQSARSVAAKRVHRWLLLAGFCEPAKRHRNYNGTDRQFKRQFAVNRFGAICNVRATDSGFGRKEAKVI